MCGTCCLRPHTSEQHNDTLTLSPPRGLLDSDITSDFHSLKLREFPTLARHSKIEPAPATFSTHAISPTCLPWHPWYSRHHVWHTTKSRPSERRGRRRSAELTQTDIRSYNESILRVQTVRYRGITLVEAVDGMDCRSPLWSWRAGEVAAGVCGLKRRSRMPRSDQEVAHEIPRIGHEEVKVQSSVWHWWPPSSRLPLWPSCALRIFES